MPNRPFFKANLMGYGNLGLGLATCFLLVLTTSLLAQGNYRLDNYGNTSILLNGAVTGTADDLGLVYYNPARLALVDTLGLSINAKVFELVNYEFRNALGESEELRNSRMRGLPGMIAKSFRIKSLPGHHFAYSFLSRYREDFSLNYRSGLRAEDVWGDELSEESQTRANLTSRYHEEWLGVSWAKEIRPGFSLGASFFASLYDLRSDAVIDLTAEDQNGKLLYFEEGLGFSQRSYGVFLILASAWKWKGVDMGVNMILPHIRIAGNARLDADEILVTPELPQAGVFNTLALQNLESSRRTALQLSYGLGFSIASHRFHFNVDWHAPVGTYERIWVNETDRQSFLAQDLRFREEFRSVVNLGVGTEIVLRPELRAIASFCTDFSAYRQSLNTFTLLNALDREVDDSSDFYHYGLGFQWGSEWGKITIGTVHSRSRSDFPNSLQLTNSERSIPVDLVQFRQNRWRFLLGFELPLQSNRVKKTQISNR